MHVSQIELLCGISSALDMVSPEVAGHHERVAYLACTAGGLLGLSATDKSRLLMAGLLHDVGALTLKSRLDTLRFETDNIEHAETGYRLLKTFPRLDSIANLVRYHHLPWRAQARINIASHDLFLANVLNAADRADVLMEHTDRQNASATVRRIEKHADGVFERQAAQAVCHATMNGYCEAVRALHAKELRLRDMDELDDPLLNLDDLRGFSRFTSHTIDFRSRFTATHSRGVSAVARELASRFDFSSDELKLMGVASNLHDLGKLAVPRSILEKPAALTREEFQTMKQHSRYTEEALSGIRGLETVKEWASSHHERLDGSGYHRGLDEKDLSLGARILAVADVFTAVTEDRPYRSGMRKHDALTVLRDMASAHKLDGEVVFCLENAYNVVDSARIASQRKALDAFENFFTAGPETTRP